MLTPPHDHQIDDHRPKGALFGVLYALIRQGIFPLKVCSEHLFPLLAAFHFPLDCPIVVGHIRCTIRLPLISSPWVPCSVTRPPSSTRILSAPTTVESRWAIMMTVRSFVSRAKAFWIKASFSGSAKAVASSSTTMGASFKMARASAMRCASPAGKIGPLGSDHSIQSLGQLFQNVAALCGFQAASTCSRLASGREAEHFPECWP